MDDNDAVLLAVDDSDFDAETLAVMLAEDEALLLAVPVWLLEADCEDVSVNVSVGTSVAESDAVALLLDVSDGLSLAVCDKETDAEALLDNDVDSDTVSVADELCDALTELLALEDDVCESVGVPLAL